MKLVISYTALSLLSVIACLHSAQYSAQALVIDNFDFPAQTISMDTSVDSMGVLGGETDFTLGSQPGIVSSEVVLNGSTATIRSIQGSFPGATFSNTIFTYDGDDDDPSNSNSFGLPNLDLTSTEGLEFEVIDFDPGFPDSRYQLTAYTSSGNAFSIVQAFTGTGTIFHSWGSFSSINSPSLAQITSITLNVILGVQSVLTIDNFVARESNQNVPEPASAALLLSGLLVGMRKRNKCA